MRHERSHVSRLKIVKMAKLTEPASSSCRGTCYIQIFWSAYSLTENALRACSNMARCPTFETAATKRPEVQRARLAVLLISTCAVYYAIVKRGWVCTKTSVRSISFSPSLTHAHLKLWDWPGSSTLNFHVFTMERSVALEESNAMYKILKVEGERSFTKKKSDDV